MKLIKLTKIKTKNAFTLVELLVAMSVFIVAITTISGIFVRAVRVQRQSALIMTINSDASLIFERFAREARQGFNFSLSNDFSGYCSAGFDTVEFDRFLGGTQTKVVYRWNPLSGDVERKEGTGSFTPLNTSQNKIDRFCFTKYQPQDSDPWRITAVLRTVPRDAALNYTVDFQTTITARTLPRESPP